MPKNNGAIGLSSSLARRDFLRILGGSMALPLVPRWDAAAESLAYPFSEVSATASGITWTHTAGLSPEKYLPESTGAGCVGSPGTELEFAL